MLFPLTIILLLAKTPAEQPIQATGENRVHVENILRETKFASDRNADARADVYMSKLKIAAIDAHWKKEIGKRDDVISWYENNRWVKVALWCRKMWWAFVGAWMLAIIIAALCGVNPISKAYRFSQFIVRAIPFGNIARLLTGWFGVKTKVVKA